MILRGLIILSAALAFLAYWFWLGSGRWEAEAGRQEQLALHWQAEAQSAEVRRRQAVQAMLIANDEANRQKEAAANYDAIRRALIEGETDVPLPADFAAALRCLLGAGDDCEDPDRGPGNIPGTFD